MSLLSIGKNNYLVVLLIFIVIVGIIKIYKHFNPRKSTLSENFSAAYDNNFLTYDGGKHRKHKRPRK